MEMRCVIFHFLFEDSICELRLHVLYFCAQNSVFEIKELSILERRT